MKVSKGFATWAGVIAALGQYLAAIAVYLEADDPSTAMDPLKTATVTLLAVVLGRMGQAAVQTVKAKPVHVPSAEEISGWTGAQVSTGTGNVTGGITAYVDRDLGAWSGSIPAGSVPPSDEPPA
jgi:hypothetical protein